MPAHDIDHADIPVLHPDAQTAFNLMNIEGQDELTIGLLNNLIPPKITATPVDSIKTEGEVFIARHKLKSHNGWYPVKQAIDLLQGCTGDISIHAVTVHHWRAFHQKLKSHMTRCYAVASHSHLRWLSSWRKFRA